MNSKVVNAILAIVIVGLNFSCQPEKFQVHKDGYQYMFIKKGNGKLPDDGDFVTYNMMYKTEKDSVLFETTEERPAVVPCNTQQWDNSGPLYKAFKIIRGGDSIIIKIPTKTLFAESFKAPIPPEFDPEGEITFCIGALKVMTEEEMQVESLKEREKYVEEFILANADKIDADVEIIETFLSDNNINAQSTKSGLRYVIDVEGTGNYPQPGDDVKVHYTGTLLDGTKFDSSLDRNQPFDFKIGVGGVIMGWDIGIPLLKKGGKGTLYIPSPLAYGEQGAGGIIKPNSVLKFDVELIDIEQIN